MPSRFPPILFAWTLRVLVFAACCASTAHAQQTPQQPGLFESIGRLLQPQKQVTTDEASVPERTLAVAGKEHRVALVIGNAAYTQGALVNPVNDARAMARRLRSLGFDVVLRENLKARDIGGVYREFRSKVTPGGVALVFYAGHGIQFKGQNYFPAIDADIHSEEDVPLQSLNLGNLLDNMEEAKAGVSLVFLDACRDNPFARRFRSATRGLAKVEAASGMLIHYATRPGSVASDGEGRNGTYTEALLAQMSEPGIPVELMLKRVANQVVAKTKGKQEPWVEGSLRGDFYFIFQGPTTVQVQAPTTDPEAETWAAAEDAKTTDGYQAYLDAYPQGRYAVAARIKLKGLQKPAAAAAVSPAPTFAPVAASSTSENPETAMWNEVKASGVREYLDAYLKQYPKGKYVALAKVELKKLDERDKAQRAKETSEKQQAAERERQEALRVEQAAWDEAKSAASVASYASYLERYPKGRYAVLAQAALLKLQREAAEQEKKEATQLAQQRVETAKREDAEKQRKAAEADEELCDRHASWEDNPQRGIRRSYFGYIDVEQALAPCLATLKRNPKNTRVQAKLAVIYFQQGKFEEGVALAKSSSKEQPISLVTLAYAARHGIGGLPMDHREAAKFLQQAADRGEPEAIPFLGTSYALGLGVEKSEARALELIRRSADTGNMEAVFLLGDILLTGRLGANKDADEATRLIRKAADTGLVPIAQLRLGQILAAKAKKPTTESEGYINSARVQFEKFSRQDSAGAQAWLGVLYEMGVGVPKDSAKAIEFYKKSASRSNSLAMTRLGIAYVDGIGTDKNTDEGKRWLKKAEEIGSEMAAKKLKEITSK